MGVNCYDKYKKSIKMKIEKYIKKSRKVCFRSNMGSKSFDYYVGLQEELLEEIEK